MMHNKVLKKEIRQALQTSMKSIGSDPIDFIRMIRRYESYRQVTHKI